MKKKKWEIRDKEKREKGVKEDIEGVFGKKE